MIAETFAWQILPRTPPWMNKNAPFTSPGAEIRTWCREILGGPCVLPFVDVLPPPWGLFQLPEHNGKRPTYERQPISRGGGAVPILRHPPLATTLVPHHPSPFFSTHTVTTHNGKQHLFKISAPDLKSHNSIFPPRPSKGA